MNRILLKSSAMARMSAFVFALFLLTSCATRVAFVPSPTVPNAQGKIKIKKDNNENYVISLDVKNLVPANQLQPPRATYMVWTETLYNGTQPLGQLRTSSGLFSSTLKASLETSSPYKPVRVFITAEDNSSVPYPGTQTVISTNPF